MTHEELYDKKVTLWNKLKRNDSATGLDVWYQTLIENTCYYLKSVAQLTGQTVGIGQMIQVLIPFDAKSAKKYKRYAEWKNPNGQAGFYTASPGDYVIIGDATEQSVTAQNLQAMISAYEPDIYEIKTVTEMNDRGGAYVQIKLEGV